MSHRNSKSSHDFHGVQEVHEVLREVELQAVEPEPIQVIESNGELEVVNSARSVNSLTEEKPVGSAHPYVTQTVGILRKVQKWSSIPFLAFTGIHLVSVVATPALFGVEAGNAMIVLGREVYQTGVVEKGLLASVLVHVTSGALLQILRRVHRGLSGHSFKYSFSWKLRFNPVRLSGWILTVLAACHVFKERWAPLRVDGDSSFVDLSYVGWALNQPGRWLVTGAGLVALVAVGVFHAGAAWPQVVGVTSKWVLRDPKRWKRLLKWAVLAAGAAAAAALARTAAETPRVAGALARRFAAYDSV